MKYYEDNSAAMSEDDNLDVESDVSVDLSGFWRTLCDFNLFMPSFIFVS